MPAPPLTRLILYVRDIPKVAAFYKRLFGMTELPGATPGWLELASPAQTSPGEASPTAGCILCLHQAAKSQKSGAAIKLVFAVRDVAAFKAAAESQGFPFGPIHDAGTHQFANAKDPNGNAISISSRSFSAAL